MFSFRRFPPFPQESVRIPAGYRGTPWKFNAIPAGFYVLSPRTAAILTGTYGDSDGNLQKTVKIAHNSREFR